MNKPQDLPEHSIRVSRKARRVLLRVIPGKGLEVVIPEQAAGQLPPLFVPDLLRRHKKWIARNLERLERLESDRKEGEKAPFPPDRLLLDGGREIVSLDLTHLSPGSDRRAWLRVNPGPAVRQDPLSVPAPGPGPASSACRKQAGDKAENFEADTPLSALLPARDPDSGISLSVGGAPEALAPLLRQWLRDEARQRLEPRLQALAQRHNLPYERLTFRFQKSRWGSCSSKGGISLNVFLLFLPSELAYYVLLHELCHTRHLNHSPSYWKLVFSLDPEALRKDRRLRRAWRYVPVWLRP